MQPALLFSKQLYGHLLAAQLNGAAADGAHQAALCAHKHLAALAARGGSVIRHNGGQHGIVALFHFIKQLCKDRTHIAVLSGGRERLSPPAP